MLTGLLIGSGIGFLVGIASAVFGPVLLRKAKEQIAKLGDKNV